MSRGVHGRAAGAVADGNADADPGDDGTIRSELITSTNGPAWRSLFLFCEPLAGWRQVTVRPRRTKIDWASRSGGPAAGRYAKAEKVILVCDNLNTHTKGAFYEAFDRGDGAVPGAAVWSSGTTPRHGSWLNIAENELSALTRQCVAGRRFGTIAALREETQAWQIAINQRQRGVDWQFRLDDARVKLKSIYPKLILD